jgi:hypothetical protein
VQWFRRYLASFTVTPIGVIVLVVILAAFGLFAFGPSGVQMPALIVGLILLIGVVGGIPLGHNGVGGWRNAGLAGRRREFGPGRREIVVSAVDQQAEEELWRNERERRAQDGR